ncbi:MAG: hypothetical protein AAF402_09735 [Pseudomonadota bacterium]
MKLLTAIFLSLFFGYVTASENSFTNIFCKTAEIRSDLYDQYENDRDNFLETLADILAAGDCEWKDYGADTKLTRLYQFNEEQAMVSAEFDGTLWYAVTFNEYVE